MAKMNGHTPDLEVDFDKFKEEGMPSLEPQQFAPPIVAFCVPCQDEVKSEFAFSLATVMYSSRVRPILIRGSSSVVSEARNNCMRYVHDFEDRNPNGSFRTDWVLFWDSDIVAPPHALERLLSHGKRIVGATYVRRAPPYDIMGKGISGKSEDIGEEGLVEVAGLPLGFMLIHRSVFDKIKRPYFRFLTIDATEEEPWGKTLSEDYAFFQACREAGEEIWLDVGLTKDLAHIGQWHFKAQEYPGHVEGGAEVKADKLGEPAQLVSVGGVPVGTTP